MASTRSGYRELWRGGAVEKSGGTGEFTLGTLVAKGDALTFTNVSNIYPGGGWLDVAGRPGCMISLVVPAFSPIKTSILP